MAQMIEIDVLADELLNILQREAVSIKEADFAQLAAHTERKTELLEKLRPLLSTDTQVHKRRPLLEKKLRRIESRAAASAVLLEALHRGARDAQRRIDTLQYDEGLPTGLYNDKGEKVDDTKPLARVSRNF